MENLNQIEIQNIRHIVSASSTLCNKIAYYKTLSQDEKVLSFLESLCQVSKSLKQELINIL